MKEMVASGERGCMKKELSSVQRYDTTTQPSLTTASLNGTQ